MKKSEFIGFDDSEQENDDKGDDNEDGVSI
jgi:hypothetical protein